MDLWPFSETTMHVTRSPFWRHARAVFFSLTLASGALGATACDGATGPDPRSAENAKSAEWLKRAGAEYQEASFEEARDSVKKALSARPDNADALMLAARIHLAMLDYGEVVRVLKGIQTPEARSIRGRALWYKGDLDAAADELEALLNEPSVKDDWAKAVAKLARRGQGRSPFAVSGELLAVVPMRAITPTTPFFVVPIEIDGEPALGLVDTGSPDVVLDNATRPDPSWVSLRLRKLEIQDVPALTRDLSGVSKIVGAPIKALLGVNLLRRLNVTIDLSVEQFIARSYSPPPPPQATRLPLFYALGGNMLLKSGLGESPASFFVDTSQPEPMVLDEAGWTKAGVKTADLKPVAADPEKKAKEGEVALFKLGTSNIQKVPGYFTGKTKEVEDRIAFNFDGILGAGLLAYYRITFADGGRVLWLEDDTSWISLLNGQTAPQGPRPPPDPNAPPGPAGPPGPGGPMPDGMPSVIVPVPGAPPILPTGTAPSGIPVPIPTGNSQNPGQPKGPGAKVP